MPPIVFGVAGAATGGGAGGVTEEGEPAVGDCIDVPGDSTDGKLGAGTLVDSGGVAVDGGGAVIDGTVLPLDGSGGGIGSAELGGVADCCGDGGIVDSVCADATPATPPTAIANRACIIRMGAPCRDA
jgi:hypothetical protein